MKLDSSVAAVVTGGASGLGAATSRALAAQGVKVAIFEAPDSGGFSADTVRKVLLRRPRSTRSALWR